MLGISKTGTFNEFARRLDVVAERQCRGTSPRGQAFGIEPVGLELQAGTDQLSAWPAARRLDLFVPADNAVLRASAQVSHRATTQLYEPVAVSMLQTRKGTLRRLRGPPLVRSRK